MSTELLKVSNIGPVNVLELRLPNGLDSTEFDRLNEQVLSMVVGAAGRSWVLDLQGVDYLGSAALGLMVNVRQQVKTVQGRLALCNLSVDLQKIFRTCCLERLFTITRTRDEAMRVVG